MKILFKIILAISITLLVSCKRDRDEEKEGQEESTKPKIEKLTNLVVNVYIENSGSMFGYINGDTEFKTDVRELLTLLRFHYSDKNVHLSFINSKIHPISTNDKISFITNLTPLTFKVGETFKSEMNNVFKQILDKSNRNTISILVSDCIYSVDGLANSLNVCKTGTKDAFLTKSIAIGGFKISTAIVKLNSKFNGVYYDMNNRNHTLNDEMRPYYMVLMGSDLALNDISSKVNFSTTEMQGYQNKLILTSNNYTNKSYYTLVKTTSDIGSYRTSKEASKIDSKKGMERIQLSDRAKGNFTFSIAVDLKNIPITSEYATTFGNYKILEGDYKIKDIIEYNSISSKKLNPTSLAMLKNYDKNPTHIITLESRSKSYSNLKIILKNQIPSWVYQTSTDDDTKSKNTLNRTFGFKYLIEGISEANKVINPNSGNFLEMNIIIN